MNHFDTQLILTLRTLISDEIDKRTKIIEEDETQFSIWDHKSDIEDMISEFINSNVTVTIET
jgi:hypothetical protein